MYKSNVISDIHARAPVDKTSALVVSNGFKYVPNKNIQTRDSDYPILTREIPKQARKNKTFSDLTGIRFGYFEVIGLALEIKNAWVVRCGCGKYSTRSAKAIKNIKNSSDRCEECRHLAYLKKRDYFHRTKQEYKEY